MSGNRYGDMEVPMLLSRFFVVVLALLGMLFQHVHAYTQETMSVQVKESEIRATPSFLGKIIVRVSYGNLVDVVEDRGAWKKVTLRNKKVQGWMHTSALTTERIALRAGQANVRTGATQSELALAGKGFSEQVETAFRKENKNLDYAWINRMETFKISPDQMHNFLVKGDVIPIVEGGRP